METEDEKAARIAKGLEKGELTFTQKNVSLAGIKLHKEICVTKNTKTFNKENVNLSPEEAIKAMGELYPEPPPLFKKIINKLGL